MNKESLSVAEKWLSFAKDGFASPMQIETLQVHYSAWANESDYKAAYNYIPGITRLERCFDFERTNKGRFTVTDIAEFDREMSFEGAVIIEGTVEELGNQKYLIKYKGKSVVLEVFSSVPIKYSVDMILEKTSGNRTFRRMSFKTVKNCRNVKMEFKYTPAQ